ncbi:diguanylate cyclase domain-containing protein, partial [Escherichia coli]|uniref:diguanylate cyclase domain-containing protein n=1 Tax=Escherichia coli TaxID=562 RepID=UPI0013D56467
ALARAARSGGDMAVLCLDLDGFKGVNDTMGHPAGDSLLCQVAAVLTELAPEGLVSRLGGDEFAVLLAGPCPPDRPRALA